MQLFVKYVIIKNMSRPKKKPDGKKFYSVKLRPETATTSQYLSALLGMNWNDLLDEIVQIGTAYIYTRRRQNLAIPIEEIPDIWEKLPDTKYKSLKGTEIPA